MQKSIRGALLLLSGMIAVVPRLQAQSNMQHEFEQPPDTAKPHVWWHWLSGNVTKEGITADLEWMHRVNIGGFQMFDGDLSTPRFVDHPLIWMTPEWKDAWRHAAAEADRLHLDMGMAASGGWSETAGPWVQPSQGMKKYVWSETQITGPGRVQTRLAPPPSTVGRYQTMPAAPALSFPTPTDLPGTKPPLPVAGVSPDTAPFYEDVKVIAYKRGSALVTAKPVITTSASNASALDASLLDGHDLGRTTTLEIAPGAKDGWIQFRYSQPTTTYAMTIGVGVAGGFLTPPLPVGLLEASDDGTIWRTLVSLPGPQQSPGGAFTLRTYAYPATNAAFYRLRLQVPPVNGIAMALGMPPQLGVSLSQVSFHTTPMVNQWEDKAAFGVAIADATTSTVEPPANTAIEQGTIVDVTDKMRTDGTLDWQVPPGSWTVLRFGYSLTGEKNHPATPAATGLEVDKYSQQDVADYTKTYTGMISGVAGSYYGKSFREYLMDSWEAGNANWTERMAEEFAARRGYSLTPYLPVLTGQIVGSAAQSDAFLWDFRLTLAEMLAFNHYGVFTDAIRPSGLSLYAEAMGTDLPTNGDGLLNKGQVTVPMGEFWTPAPGQSDLPTHVADTREAASAAHIYGKPVAAAESFTTAPNVAGWAQSPFYLKLLADENFARGINRIVIHTSDEQPFTDETHKPGLTLGPFGQNYTRNITWAEQSVAWNTYLARTSYLLQQGSYVADVAYFYGEGSPAVVPYWKTLSPAAPKHYGYDFVNADVLLHHSRTENGRLTLDGGMSYKLLVVPADTTMMTLPLLRRLKELVSTGTTLLAPRPLRSPSLSDEGKAQEFTQLVQDLWGPTGPAQRGHTLGTGTVFAQGEIEPLLASLSASPDLTYKPSKPSGPALIRPMPVGDSTDDLVYLHRHLLTGDLYFLATQKLTGLNTEVSFRVVGRRPTAWNPMTGKVSSVTFSVHDGVTTIPLHFDAVGSLFIVFDDSSNLAPPAMPSAFTSLKDLSSGWSLQFSDETTKADVKDLQSWTSSNVPDEKYFSGTATYRRTVQLSAAEVGNEAWLDLGDVREIAEVFLNGIKLDQILWAPPYRVSVAKLLHAGANTIEVRVTNLWPNRLIGDEQPGNTKRHTFTGIHAYTKDSPLLKSGMLGPVMLLKAK